MLKRLAIIGVLFIVAQTPMPASGQTPNKSTQDSQKQTAPADGGKHPSPRISPVIPEKGTSGADQPKSNEGTKTDNQATIIVSEPASVPVVWHWYERVSWVANLVLVVGGVIGIWIALRTLKWLKHQSLSARMGAKAALKQASHIVASERARMIPKITQPDERKFEMASDMEDDWILPIKVTFTNHGITPALATWGLMEITSEKILHKTSETAPTLILDLLVPPKYGPPPDRYVPGAYYVHKAKTPSYESIDKKMIVMEMPAWKLEQKCLCVKGYIKYMDTFGQERISRYCYAYQKVSGIRALPNIFSGNSARDWEFRKCGPDAYNEIT